MDINRALRTAVSTGKVQFGIDQTKRSIETKNSKLVVVSSNCPDEELKAKEIDSVKVYHFKGTNIELGAACGKPFSISALSIIDPGSSNITDLQ